MRYKIIIIIVSILSFYFDNASAHSNTTPSSNDGYHIKVNAPFAKGSMAYLAQYWKGAPYSIDSAQVSQNGTFTFAKPEKLISGQYLLYIKPDTQIELLIDKEQNNIEIDLNEDVSKSSIKGNEDTRWFWDYIRQYNILSSNLENLSNTIQNKEVNNTDRITAKEQYKKNITEIENFFTQQVTDRKGTWFASFTKASQNISVPYPFPDSDLQYQKNKQYLAQHYLDNIDFLDTRLWNTVFFTSLLDKYLFEIIPQHPDSIAQAATKIVYKTLNSDTAFELMLSHLYNEASTSNLMGMENVWAKLAEDYIFDKNINWIDSTSYSDLLAQYSLIQSNRLGMKAQDMKLMTIDGDSVHTNNIDAAYTLLYFYSPNCSHCDHEMPVLRNDFFPKYKHLGLKVIAINVNSDVEEWKKFMEKHDMNIEGWVNLFDPNYQSQYWLKYETNGTPSLYFLDKDKTIIARKINVESLEKILNRER